MKKKQLDNYMNEYRATTKVSPDKDLCKRQSAPEQSKEDVPLQTPIYRRLSFWGIAVIVLVLVSVLPVAVVLELRAADHASINADAPTDVVDNGTPNNTDISDHIIREDPAPVADPVVNPIVPDEQTIYYAEESELSFDIVDGSEELISNNQMNIIMPALESDDTHYYKIRLIEKDIVIGLAIESFIYSEDYSSLFAYAFLEQYALDAIKFRGFTDEAPVNDITVSYKLIVDDEDYIYSLEFKYDDHLYQAVVTCYDEKPIQDILSDCFGL